MNNHDFSIKCENELCFFDNVKNYFLLKIVSKMLQDNFNKINVATKKHVNIFLHTFFKKINQLFIHYKQFNYRYNN